MAKPKIIKLVNGAPALMLVNGKGKKHMANKSTKSAPKKAAPKKKPNPSTTKKHKSRPRKRPNPDGVIWEVLAGLGGLAATNVATGYLSSWFPQISANPLLRIGSKFGVSYFLGTGVQKLAPGGFKRYASSVRFGGYMSGGMDGFNYLFPTFQTIFLPGGGALDVASSAQPDGNDDSMQDIVDLPAGEEDEYYGDSPDFGQMQDVVDVDENYSFQ